METVCGQFQLVHWQPETAWIAHLEHLWNHAYPPVQKPFQYNLQPIDMQRKIKLKNSHHKYDKK